MKLKHGATQGGAYSPYKGVIIAEPMAMDVQEKAKTSERIPTIAHLQLSIVMYADDAIQLGEEERALQNSFTRSENRADKDGTKLSRPKCELIVMDIRPKGNWE